MFFVAKPTTSVLHREYDVHLARLEKVTSFAIPDSLCHHCPNLLAVFVLLKLQTCAKRSHYRWYCVSDARELDLG